VNHLPDLIQDLGFILITAAAVSLLFKKLGQPVVLGYLIAGFLLSPHVALIPTVKDTESVKVWAEIGVIFLLFGLGLEFSFKRLTQVGRSAVFIAVFEVLFMLGLGYGVGRILNWSIIDSIYLGAMLSISSTTIIVRALSELGLKGRKFVSLVFGVLVIEDIVAVLLLVTLTTLSVSQSFQGEILIWSTLKLLFFLILWFVIGIYVLPTLIKKITPLLSEETSLIVSIGLCLLMVMIASQVGFSPALGAFIMGSLIAETSQGHRIELLIRPVRDLFAAIFFVSVGLLINPLILQNYSKEILIITLVTVFGKFISSTIAGVVSGVSIKRSVQVGMSLSQIGEFSFIIATLGMTLKVTSEFLYPIAVVVSAITTFTTPFLIRSSDGVSQSINKILPQAWLNRLEMYQSTVQHEGARNSLVAIFFNLLGWRILFNCILTIACLVFVPSPFGFVLCMPFLWAVIFGFPKSAAELQNLNFGFSILRIAIAFFVLILTTFYTHQSGNQQMITGVIGMLGVLLIIFKTPWPQKVYEKVERRFVSNYENDGISKPKAAPIMAPWDVGLTSLVILPESALVGKKLKDTQLKDSIGVTVTLVERGEARIMAPSGDFVLMPHDRLHIIGSDEQIEKVKSLIAEKVNYLNENMSSQSIGLKSVIVSKNDFFADKQLKDSQIREKLFGLVVGVERGSVRILSPGVGTVLLPGDLVWIVGDLDKISEFKKNQNFNESV
jgi:monovalent cation:H+ antiporter-2, CPA2 family